ncbi:MAG TPA: endonuclease/exonuclease/phosphatase family protein [Vicinamibacterales bacterium]
MIRFFVISCFAFLTALPVSADFTMISQNLWRFGHRVGATDRDRTFKREVSGGDVVVVQELMDPIQLGNLNPGNHVYLVSALLGRGTYREAYGFLVRNTLGHGQVVTYADPNDDFEREPSFIEIRPPGRQTTWVGNVHVIFARRRRIARRQAEVRALPAAINAATTNARRVVVGGDWNLPATHAAFDTLRGAGYTISPNDRTTLVIGGRQVSRYDHFASSPAVRVTGQATINPSTLNRALDLPTWRTNISDHLGITCNVAD